jgi:hypothetical protein
MVRLLFLILGMLTTNRVGGRKASFWQDSLRRDSYGPDERYESHQPDEPYGSYEGRTRRRPQPDRYGADHRTAPTVAFERRPPLPSRYAEGPYPGHPGSSETLRPAAGDVRPDDWRPDDWRPGGGDWRPGDGDWRAGDGGGKPNRRRWRIPLRARWIALIVVLGLIFRRVIAFFVVAALSAAFHLVGLNIHLPNIKFAWPWQTISAGTTTDTEIGPWVLQKLEGISRPALGTENFNFVFTHKVSKSIGFWPCWYSATFYAVGHASATVNLNPGPSWWTRPSGHYQLQVLSRPAAGKPGHVTVTIVLPQPQLPQSVHDITIDNTLSQPIDTQHSWTYPGFGCGVLLKPQFSLSVVYAQAQNIAFYRATHLPQVTQPLITTAEAQATQTIRNNFIQPTVNAFGYNLDRFTISWVK